MIPRIKLPGKLIPVFAGDAMYRGAYGGRGSGKTMSFAKMAAVRGIVCSQENLGGLIVCGREMQNSLDDSSMAEVKAAIRSEEWMLDYYDIGEKYITTKDGLIDFSFVGLRHNIDSVKSKAKIRLLWVDEGEKVSATSWDKADNTVREEGAEVWVTWNPERKGSPTDIKFRQAPPPESKIIALNWRDNLKFPETLNKKRLHCLETDPDQYDHIWEGGYITAMSGAYFAKQLAKARQEYRVGNVANDPLMTLRAFWDIGGTGAKADACAVWICQFIGREIRVLDYYEAVGQQLSVHVAWLRDSGYGSAKVYLPHDGVNHDKVFDVTYESELRRAGFDVTVIKNQGAGAANQRIEAVRRILPSCHFNEAKCSGGLDALGWYHEKRDEARNIGLGPEHDWSSHGCDAFGLMAIVAEDIFDEAKPRGEDEYYGGSGWMS
ncbi:MAG: phage terminase large subunit [Methylobacter sp.]